MKNPITTHVLDTSRGQPAAGVAVSLARQAANGEWQELAQTATNAEGRVSDLFPAGAALEMGIYRLTFDTGGYFRALGGETFYPYAAVVFEIKKTEQHYHVPLLLNPFGYSTYRGS